jgi:hypothetical protein
MIFPSTSKNGKRLQSSSGLRKNLEINAERKPEIANRRRDQIPAQSAIRNDSAMGAQCRDADTKYQFLRGWEKES